MDITKTPSPRSRFLRKINTMTLRSRPFRVAILGQNGVGKTALAVRFCTRRYIGEYDPVLERIYTCQRTIQDSQVEFEVWDTAGVNENSRLKEHIRWADAVILVYDVTDRCSFDECSRLKFLVNSFTKRFRWKSVCDPSSEPPSGLPVVLVGNKTDKETDRMVLHEEGAARSSQLKCLRFTEVSVRENVDDVIAIFEELFVMCRNMRKFRITLSFSRLSLIDDKPRSKSDDDEHDNEDKEEIRRGTLPSRSETKTQGSLGQMPRSRRRESIFTAP